MVVIDLLAKEWKIKARKRARLAIERGKLVRPRRCARCGKFKRVQAHHEDYDKPLQVEWLCETCHRKHHRVRRTHCPKGHEFTPENTRWEGQKRHCKACNRIHNKGAKHMLVDAEVRERLNLFCKVAKMTQEKAANVAIREMLARLDRDPVMKAKMDRVKELQEELASL